ncbi:hypothetical protein V5F69_17750 [Xanthobacter sp. V2C-4]|uniref:hypothetical protein n=2 Tax=Xanthobacter albus TaxID=3119929 RepID=UPI00372955A4
MLRFANRMMILFRALAFRRSVVMALVIGLVAGPLLNAVSARHVDEAKAAAVGLDLGFSDPGGLVPDIAFAGHSADQAQRDDTSSPLADASAVDHGCHGCVAFMLPTVAAARFERLTSAAKAGKPVLTAGRIVPTEIRPPCA